MNKPSRRNFIRVLTTLALLAVAIPVMARQPKTEAQLVADLDSPKDKVVINAIQDIEKNYPASATGVARIKALLADPRQSVVRKAAWMLGTTHAEVNETDLKNIAALLDATEKPAVLDGLKSLRGLKAQSTIPKIIPLLQNPDLNIKRDSMRTLAVLGDKNLVPAIQPFLTFPDLAVQKDAADAITILKEK